MDQEHSNIAHLKTSQSHRVICFLLEPTRIVTVSSGSPSPLKRTSVVKSPKSAAGSKCTE